MADVFERAQRARDLGITALVRAHHPRDGVTGDAALVRVANDHLLLEGVSECRIERQRLDADVGVAKREAVKSAEGGAELILLAAGQCGFDGLHMPSLLGELAPVE